MHYVLCNGFFLRYVVSFVYLILGLRMVDGRAVLELYYEWTMMMLERRSTRNSEAD